MGRITPMQIYDFHSKLTSVNDEGHLFEALRSLSRIEDTRVFDDEDLGSDWPNWPPMAARAPRAASLGV
jgi:hypothetical protein